MTAPPFMLKEPVVIYLPFPPSVNNLFANGKKGRYPTKSYGNWRAAAGWELQAQRPAKLTGSVQVRIYLEEPKRKRDASNCIKAIEDLLVTHQVIEADDNTTVRKVSAQWCPVTRGCRVEVEAA